MKIITFANQKGGVGKTSSVVNIAYILRNIYNKKVLVIDLDAQFNSTDTYRAQQENVATIYDVLHDGYDINQTIQHVGNMDIIAGDPNLSGMEKELVTDEEGYNKLKDAIKNLKKYDYVIIDTNPDLNLLLINALVVSDSIMVPVEPGRYSIMGLTQLINTFYQIKDDFNPKLKIDGMFIVRCKKNTILHREAKRGLKELAKQYTTKIFDTTIRDSVDMGTSQAAQKPLYEYKKRSPIEADYEALVKEWRNFK